MLDTIVGLPGPLVLAVAGLILLGEPAILVGVVLPSVSTGLMLGFLAYSGAIPLGAALATAVGAVVVGDGLAFLAGRRSGAALATGRAGRLVGVQRWEKASGLLRRHGGRSVFVSRWLVGARTLVPRLAGAAGLPWRRFAVWSLPAGVVWSCAYVLAGYLAGSSYRQVSALVGQATLAVAGLVAAVAGAVLIGRWLGRDPDRPARLLRLRVSRSASVGALAVVLLVVAAGLAALVGVAVQGSGLPRLDGPVATAVTLHRAEFGAHLLGSLLVVTPAGLVITLAGVLALVRPVTSGRHRGDALGTLALAGAAVPLVILTLVLHVAEGVSGQDNLFAIQSAILTSAITLGAWTLGRRTGRPARVTIWAAGGLTAIVLAAARVYVGWGTVSSTTAAFLVGLIWTGLFAVAWDLRASREQLPRRGPVVRPAPGR